MNPLVLLMLMQGGSSLLSGLLGSGATGSTSLTSNNLLPLLLMSKGGGGSSSLTNMLMYQAMGINPLQGMLLSSLTKSGSGRRYYRRNWRSKAMYWKGRATARTYRRW